MCGIVGGITNKDVGHVLLQGLKRLEYRGYDSAGIAIISPQQKLIYKKITGKVNDLVTVFAREPIDGHCGLAHTRWATHGEPSAVNAHPHISNNQIAIVHNGIIENYETIKSELLRKGYTLTSGTDSEVIAHLIHSYLEEQQDLLSAVRSAVKCLNGMYAIGVISSREPDCIIAARLGSPLVIGRGDHENFVASDSLALQPLTNRFIYLEEGDFAKITQNAVTLYDQNGEQVVREVRISEASGDLIDLGNYSNFMEKEIFEQPAACARMLEGRIDGDKLPDEIFGISARQILQQVEQITIVACGTSYHAAMVGRYWLEEIAEIPCQVEVASEYRYRHAIIKPNTLFVVLSQSGETADTLSSLCLAKTQGYLSTLAICNVPGSALVRESELVLLTHAGPEIGVASTKSWTCQLMALLMLAVVMGRHHHLAMQQAREIIQQLRLVPELMVLTLSLKNQIKQLAKILIHKGNVLFLGRGCMYPVAMEGALKLKEITYIHAEAYPAGELKHGPLAMVDKEMPVVVVAPHDRLFKKLYSNLQEVRARGGELIVFADGSGQLQRQLGAKTIAMPNIKWYLAPMIYTVPLQLLSYYVGVLRGADVDQPRNLAKSVTVE
jgi:glutamine---fructose-6-phosphate transaminase (isomerizing)